MLELQTDIWDIETPAVICITTNGDVNSWGQAVMGRGVAKQASVRYPELRREFAMQLDRSGNVLQIIGQHVRSDGRTLVAFPVKNHWWEQAELYLIKESAVHLITCMRIYEWERVYLPKPGCGNGDRDWESEVKPILEDILDDRVVVVDRAVRSSVIVRE